MTFRTVEITDIDLRLNGRADATVMSEALGRRADCSFWTPQIGGDGPLPLVILLHGVYGSHWAWLGRGGADVTAARLIADDHLPACVLAMPSDGLIGHGSGYVRHHDADVPVWILDEVPRLAAMVDARVDAEAPIGLVGLSMGGFGALRLAAVAGPRVVAAAGLSSITALDQLRIFGASPPEPVGEPTDESVLAAALANRDTLPALRFDCGTTDLLIEHNRQLHADFARHGIEHEWTEHDGSHEWPYWRRHLPAALEFVGRSFRS
jgi:putative tributyrin esterase